MVGGSHDSGSGLKLRRLSRLEGETSREWAARGVNVSRDETLLRDMPPALGGGGWWWVVMGITQVELSFVVGGPEERVTTSGFWENRVCNPSF